MTSSDRESEETETTELKNEISTKKITKNNVMAFGSLYFIDGVVICEVLFVKSPKIEPVGFASKSSKKK